MFSLRFTDRKMAQISIRGALIILLFNVVVPSMDQYTDITIIMRLMAGPDPDTHLLTSKHSKHWLKLSFLPSSAKPKLEALSFSFWEGSYGYSI